MTLTLGTPVIFPRLPQKRTLTLTLACSSRFGCSVGLRSNRKHFSLRETSLPFEPGSYQARIVMRDSSSRRVFLHRIANLEGQDILFKNMDLYRHLNFNHADSHKEVSLGHEISRTPASAHIFTGTLQLRKPRRL